MVVIQFTNCLIHLFSSQNYFYKIFYTYIMLPNLQLKCLQKRNFVIIYVTHCLKPTPLLSNNYLSLLKTTLCTYWNKKVVVRLSQELVIIKLCL